MKTVADHGLVLVDLMDAEGYDTGRSVAVECWWVTEFYEHGADADGRRGVPWQCTDVLDLYINPAVCATLNSAQVEQCLDSAAKMIEQRGGDQR